jgi:hypothetical protein
MDNDGRIIKRKELVFYLDVVNTETGNSIGRLVDLTTRGCKVVSREGFDLRITMALSIVLPDDRYGMDALCFNAITRWSRPDVNPEYLVTGFEMIRLGAQERKIVRKLMDQLGFYGES